MGSLIQSFLSNFSSLVLRPEPRSLLSPPTIPSLDVSSFTSGELSEYLVQPNLRIEGEPRPVASRLWQPAATVETLSARRPATNNDEWISHLLSPHRPAERVKNVLRIAESSASPQEAWERLYSCGLIPSWYFEDFPRFVKAINARSVEGVTYSHPLTFDDLLAFATIPPAEIARILALAREANDRCRLWQSDDDDKNGPLRIYWFTLCGDSPEGIRNYIQAQYLFRQELDMVCLPQWKASPWLYGETIKSYTATPNLNSSVFMSKRNSIYSGIRMLLNQLQQMAAGPYFWKQACEQNLRVRELKNVDASNRLYRDLPDPFAPYIHFDGLYDMGVTIHTWCGNRVYLGIPPLWLDASLSGER